MRAPHTIRNAMGFTEVRAVADLARAEEWDDIYSAVVPSLQEKNGLVKHVRHDIKHVGQDIKHVGHDIKQVRLSPYLAFIGLAGIVGVTALIVKHRKI